jgi:hypothetical protein
MNETLFCGIDLHCNNAMYVITDQDDKPLFQRRLPNQLPVVLAALEPFRQRLKVVAVESTYNWYWLVDSLQGGPSAGSGRRSVRSCSETATVCPLSPRTRWN